MHVRMHISYQAKYTHYVMHSLPAKQTKDNTMVNLTKLSDAATVSLVKRTIKPLTCNGTDASFLLSQNNLMHFAQFLHFTK